MEVLKSIVFHLNGVFFLLTPERLIKTLVLVLNVVMLYMGVRYLKRDIKLGFLLLAFVLPLVLNLGYSLLITPILGNAQSAGRYFIILLIPYLVLLASGWQYLFEQTRRQPVLFCLLFIAFLSLYMYCVRAMFINTTFSRDDNRRLCEILFTNAREADYIVAFPSTTLNYYAARFNRDLDKYRLLTPSRYESDIFAGLPENPMRVWLFFEPIHHFKDRIREFREKNDLKVVIEEVEQGLSGVGLFLLESHL